MDMFVILDKENQAIVRCGRTFLHPTVELVAIAYADLFELVVQKAFLAAESLEYEDFLRWKIMKGVKMDQKSITLIDEVKKTFEERYDIIPCKVYAEAGGRKYNLTEELSSKQGANNGERIRMGNTKS